MKIPLLFCLLFSSVGSTVLAQQTQDLEKKLSKASAPEEKVKLLNQISDGLTDTNPTLAIDYSQKAVTLAQELQDSTELGCAYDNISLSYYWMNDLPKATAYTYKALSIREKQKDSLNIAKSYNTLGIILLGQKRYDKGLPYFEKALLIAKRKKNRERIMISLSNIGNSYQHLNQPEKALAYYLEGYELNKQVKDTLNLSIDELLLGNIYRILKRPKEAYDHLYVSLRLSEQVGNEVNKMHAYRFLAELYHEQKQYNKGLKVAQNSLSIAKKLKSPEGIQEASVLLNKLYLAQNNFKKAHEYLTLAYDSKDTLHTRNQHKALAEMNIKYESEKKENENLQLRIIKTKQEERIERESITQAALAILLFLVGTAAILFYRSRKNTQEINQRLRESNTLISKKNKAIEKQTKATSKMALQLKNQNAELENLNKQKDTIFSIIAHDLRGPLISLKSLLQLMQMGAVPAERMDGFFKEINTQQQNSLVLLDNLLMWARSQMNGLVVNPKPLKLHRLVTENLQLLHLQADKKGISVFNDVPDTLWVSADFEMVKLVLRNLISNSIKFCNSGDMVQITAEAVSPETIKITVRDTGVGISAEDQQKLFQLSKLHKKGTDKEGGSGLGLMLCKEFVEKNNGTIWVESAPGIGSKFYFTLDFSPVPSKQRQVEITN